MDAFGNPTERDPPNPFVQLLWHRGMLHAREVMQDRRMPVLDLSASRGEEKERRTQEALEEGAPFIYGGEIGADDLLGAPGLLRREGGGYVASDIKSGASEEGPEEHRRLKVHYAVQLALYTGRLGAERLSAGRRGFIWDIDGQAASHRRIPSGGLRFAFRRDMARECHAFAFTPNGGAAAVACEETSDFSEVGLLRSDAIITRWMRSPKR